MEAAAMAAELMEKPVKVSSRPPPMLKAKTATQTAIMKRWNQPPDLTTPKMTPPIMPKKTPPNRAMKSQTGSSTSNSTMPPIISAASTKPSPAKPQLLLNQVLRFSLSMAVVNSVRLDPRSLPLALSKVTAPRLSK